MADLVSLRSARKRRRRADKEAAAAEARARHGRTRAEREAQHVAAERAARALDGHRREGPPDK